jgi:hypothetical protein
MLVCRFKRDQVIPVLIRNDMLNSPGLLTIADSPITSFHSFILGSQARIGIGNDSRGNYYERNRMVQRPESSLRRTFPAIV